MRRSVALSLLYSATAHNLAPRSAPQPAKPQGIGRRHVIGVLPTLLTPCAANALPFFGDGGTDGVTVSTLTKPELCQARCRDQDFIVVRYVGRRTDTGAVFDDRYAQQVSDVSRIGRMPSVMHMPASYTPPHPWVAPCCGQPLTYELGSFYLPGVDPELDGRCVGTRLKYKWARSPSLGAQFDAALPPGTPIELELELKSIKYSLFGEKMRNASSTYWFNPAPLSLTSAVDERGHASVRSPIIKKENWFSIAPGEKSLISNPSSLLQPLFEFGK